jgi:hypothetical protein
MLSLKNLSKKNCWESPYPYILCEVHHEKKLMGRVIVRNWLCLINMQENTRCLRQRRFRGCYNGLRWNLLNTNKRNKLIWKGFLTCNGLLQEITSWIFLLNLKGYTRWEHPSSSTRKKIIINQVIIHEQLGISFERIVH